MKTKNWSVTKAAEMEALLKRLYNDFSGALTKAIVPPQKPTTKDEMAGECFAELVTILEELQVFSTAIRDLARGKTDPLKLPKASLETSFLRRVTIPNMRAVQRGQWIATYYLDPDKRICEGLFVIDPNGKLYKLVRKLVF